MFELKLIRVLGLIVVKLGIERMRVNFRTN
ncbi:hypothetical protein SAMN04488552_2954 [Christiangramia echinicola]|uniref:Uncharacterized protein n=1 Tax=Christiangramia echinicola TaxID=279359 RepID=A0A1H1RMS0_9FLAO|nr:hypothetical protein SAMN04488552_2954 [Christiangramia echinicola]